MKPGNLVTAIAVAVALACAGGWLQEHRTVRELQRAQVYDTLGPVAEMLRENARITQELRAATNADGNADLASAYLVEIRRDGVPKHSDMKQRIDRINNNNTAVLALLSKYSEHAKASAFKASEERFRDYAISLRDRWQSVPEIFMAGGNLAVAAPPFPAEFSDALTAELAHNGA
jgi:hypothetical protein